MTTSAAGNAIDKSLDKTLDKRRALGRGLDSLLPAAGPRVIAGTAAGTAERPEAAATIPADATTTATAGVIAEIHGQAARAAAGGPVREVPLDQIDGNPYQTRSLFDQEALRELADSIRVNGVLQPIVVRPAQDGRYLLVLGERRCRASKLAGKTTIPAVVRQVSEEQAAEMTVVENLQRQDLTCIEQAKAFAKLSQDFGLTQGQIGDRVGLSRESVSNYMRLLKLPRTVQGYMETRAIGFSEARELLKLEDNDTIAAVTERMFKERWSLLRLMDEIEDINIQRNLLPQEKQATAARWVDPNVRAAARELQKILGVKVKISDRKGKGKIVIQYATLEDFDRVMTMLKGKR